MGASRRAWYLPRQEEQKMGRSASSRSCLPRLSAVGVRLPAATKQFEGGPLPPLELGAALAPIRPVRAMEPPSRLTNAPPPVTLSLREY
jgi:hypothetical protein